jgi:hypothetical protein
VQQFFVVPSLRGEGVVDFWVCDPWLNQLFLFRAFLALIGFGALICFGALIGFFNSAPILRSEQPNGPS